MGLRRLSLAFPDLCGTGSNVDTLADGGEGSLAPVGRLPVFWKPEEDEDEEKFWLESGDLCLYPFSIFVGGGEYTCCELV
jgi:hypothetical protein